MVVNDMRRSNGLHGRPGKREEPGDEPPGLRKTSITREPDEHPEEADQPEAERASMEAMETRLLLAVTGLNADFSLNYVWGAPDGTMSFQATPHTVSPSWQVELANTQAAGPANWAVDGLTFNAPYALADLSPAASSSTGFSYTWSNLVLAPGPTFSAGASQQGQSAFVYIPVSVTRSFVGSQITGSGDLTTTITVVPEAGLADGFQAEIDVYAVQGADGQLAAQPFGTVADAGTVQGAGTVTVAGGAYSQQYDWSVPQAVAGQTYVFSCTVHVVLNNGVPWAEIEPSVRVGGHKLAEAGSQAWAGNTLALPNGGNVAISSARQVSDDNPAHYLNWYGVLLPFAATAGPAPAVPHFDAGSDMITNPFLGLAQVGDIYTLSGGGDFAGQFRAYSLTAREKVLGVDCLVLSIDTYNSTASLQYYDLRVAQDTAGDLRVLKITGLDAAGHDVTWQAGSLDQTLLFMPGVPAADDQLGWRAGQATWIDGVGQSTATLGSGLGPYHNCAVRGWADGTGEQYAWFSSGAGVVQEQWTSYSGTSGTWQRMAPSAVAADWEGDWQAGGYQMDAATGTAGDGGATGATSTQTAATSTVTITRRADGTYSAGANYAFVLTAEGDSLSGQTSGNDQQGDYLESYFRMLEISPGVAVMIYGVGGHGTAGNWWGSCFAGLAHMADWTASGRPFIGEYDLDEFEIQVGTTGGAWATHALENTPDARISYQGSGQYAWYDLANLSAPAPVYVQDGSRLIRNTSDYAAGGDYVHWFQVVYPGPDDTLYYLGHETGIDGPDTQNLLWASFYAGVARPRAGFEWKADLTATIDMHGVPLVALSQQTFKVPVHLTNSGAGAAAGKVRVLLYASTDQTLGPGDVLIGSLDDQAIAIAGKTSKVLTVNAQIPAWMANDDYNLLAVVDADNAIAEVNENNNTAVGATMFQVDQAKRDLVGQLGSISLGDVFVPGDRGTIPLAITNSGNVPAVGKIDIKFYLSTDQVLDAATDYPLATLAGQSLNLAAGKSGVFTARFTVGPNAPAGTYYVLADIDPGGVIDELNKANNLVVSSTTRELAWKFGAVGGRANVRLTVADAAGVLTTFSLTGPGWGQVLGGSGLAGVEVSNSTATSVMRITTPAGRTTAVGGILLKGDLGELSAPTVALKGDLTAKLSLRKLTLGDVSGGHLLAVNTLGAYPAGDHTTAMAFGRVDEASIDTHGIAIASLSAVEWVDADGTADRIVAPWLGKLTVTGRAANAKAGVTASAGDFQADLVLSGTNLPPRQATLGSATVAGLADGAWDITGDAGAVRAGRTGGTWEFNVLTGTAASLDVAGDLAGSISAQSFGRIAASGGLLASITALAAAPVGGMSIGTLTGGCVSNFSLTVPAGIGTVTVVEWLDADAPADVLHAGWIGQLTTTGRKAVPAKGVTSSAGDFQADLTLTGAALPARKIALGGVKIAGGLSGSTWDITGNLGKLTVTGRSVGSTVRTTGGMAALTFGATDTSHFLAGIDPAVTDHARLVGDFKNVKATIGSISVLGHRLPAGDATDFVIDTQFSAATMGTVSLLNTNSGTTCGLYVLAADGKEIRSLRYSDTLTGEAYTWNSAKGAWAHFSSLTIERIGA
jgi:hypothetical protein